MRRGQGEVRGGTAARDVRGRRTGSSFLALLAVLVLGCSQFDVRAKQDPNADFGRLRTFAWLPVAEAEPADQRVNDRFIDRRIRNAVERDLQAKGYQPAASGPVDFLLNYRLTTSPDDSLSGHGPGYARGLWGGWPGAAVFYDNYDVGTLYLAALDAPTKRMIWVGAARARLVPHLSEEKRKKRADAAVEKILASFPKR